ncbi:hypothetical protein ACN28C_27590 [Plantactinospora sp. WMMC1484]|uniref:hypothetical protein n=1 Tax=Plantactinospora sp. WMMC1484 TaxID=3404122 RepID=UPI003BF5AB0C
MKRLLAALVAALVTTVAVVVTAGPALAADPWPRIPCASGTLDATVTDEKEGDFLTLAGQLDCADPKAAASFGYAIYESVFSHGLLYASHFRPYAPAGSTPFHEAKRVPDGEVDLAICVVTDYDARVACLRAVWDYLEGAVVVRPLPTDDPLVDRVVQVVAADWKPRPVCGTCW